jgi:biofilm protein TabA
MILSSLADADLYRELSPGIAAGLRYLQTFDHATPNGRYALDGDALFALVSSYDTGPATEKRFESHRSYLDIQYLAGGTERILHAPARLLTAETRYSEIDDVLFYQEPGYSSSLLLRTGDFTIFAPADAHKPGCMAGGRTHVKKVVLKVKI